MSDVADALREQCEAHWHHGVLDQAWAQWCRACAYQRAAAEGADRQDGGNRAAKAREHLVFSAMLEEVWRSEKLPANVDLENAYVRLRADWENDPADFAIMLHRRLRRGRGLVAAERRRASSSS